MPMWGYHYSYGMGYGPWAMLFGTIIVVGGLALFALLIWGVATLFERSAQPSAEQPGPWQPLEVSALETLGQRYARGEIDERTYERMRERLTMTSAAAPAEPQYPASLPH